MANCDDFINLDERAKADYEQSRKNVGGRKPWDKLDPRDPYDVAMMEAARSKIRRQTDGLGS